MNNIFFLCNNLSELDLSSFNINNITYTGEIFSYYNNINNLLMNKLYVNKFYEKINF